MMQMAQIKDSLRRIEEKLDKLLEEKKPTETASGIPVTSIPMQEKLTEMQERMAKARAARKINTGEGGRG